MTTAALPRILIVDDEAPIRASISRLLLFEDYAVECASGAEEALRIIDLAHIDVVVSDQQMPGMQGVDLLRAIRERSPTTSRILFSGHVDIELLRKAVNGGEVYRFITKPWDDDELRLAIRHGIERAELMRHNEELRDERDRQNRELKQFNANLSDMVRKRTEDLEFRNRALALNQEVLDHLPVLVVGIDPAGLLVLVNKLGRERFPEAIPGLHCADCLPPDLAAWMIQTIHAPDESLILTLKGTHFCFEAMSLDDRGLIASAYPIEPPIAASGTHRIVNT